MKKLFIIISLILGIICSVSDAESPSPPKRIISLAPNMTEILFALGLGENIIAVTTFCDYPEEAKKKPKIGGMSNPSLEAVVSMKPDIVVMTTDGNPREFQERLTSFKIKTFVSDARRLNELPRAIREVGMAMGVKDRAEKLARETEGGIRKASDVRQESKKHFSSPLAPPASRKKVLFIVWPEPLIVAGPGTIMDDAIRLLDHENIAAKAKTAYPKYSLEEVIRQAPDVIFVGKATGMDMRSVFGGILKRMASVPAVRNNKVFFVSDNLYRLGPRVVKGIEEMAGDLERGK